MKKLLVLVTLLSIAAPTRAVVIDTIQVDNVANAPDLNHGGDGQFGSVDYFYQISTTEVTNDQYAEFLNAIAAVDTHRLYSGGYGIDRHSSPDGFFYTVQTNHGNKPVIQVSFWDAIRFANWLHNGQPTGTQNNLTTEAGAYSLGGVTDPPISSVARNAGAKWFLPSDDEWYKAAYHQPAAQGGDYDDYWFYPTASNDQPVIAMANSVGDISNPGANVVNHWDGARWNDTVTGKLTTVASAGPLSASFYGTFDQAGNVEEWIEDIHNFSPNTRVVRGGDWRQSNEPLSAAFRNGRPPNEERDHVGFRVATIVPEPSTSLLTVFATGAFLIVTNRRSKRISLNHLSLRDLVMALNVH